MKNILIAIRSIFKKGRHNVMKIVSLGIGLAAVSYTHLTLPTKLEV